MPHHKAHALNTLRFSHGITQALLRDFPQDKLTFQPCPTDNHVLWTIGHLASAMHWFAMLIDGRASSGGEGFPERWQSVFGYGSKPVPAWSVYPDVGEAKAEMERAFARIIAGVEAQTDDDLTLPSQGDSHGVAPLRIDAALLAAWHEGWHGGQLATIRKHLGLPPVM